MNGLVSIIIPVYNVELYLEECIKSVINQTYKKIEIILIDDGSTDGSTTICKKYKNIDSRIKYYRQKNSGQSVARNKGIDIAKGEYIYFLDSDDYIKSTAMEELLNFMKSSGSDLCYFSSELINELGGQSFLTKNIYDKKCAYPISDGISILSLLVKNDEYTCQNCMFISKSDLIKKNKIRYTEGIIYEDNYFAFLLAIHSQVSSVYNKRLYYRRVREGSTMTSDMQLKRRIMSYRKVLDDFCSIKTNNIEVKKLLVRFKRGFVFAIVKYVEMYNNPTMSKEIYKYFCNNLFFYDVKLFLYLHIRNICNTFHINDPFNLIK